MKRTLVLLAFLAFVKYNMAQTFTPLIENLDASFRGLATYSNETIWLSGSKGKVGFSNDNGKNWTWVNPKGYEEVDFRDIQVFSKKEAVIISAGSPAVVLKTTNAGKTWIKVFEDLRSEAFFDAMDFNGKTGYILGDPSEGVFQLLKSTNKGKSWKDISTDFILFADEGEVAFAASGSNIQAFKDRLYIGTGGRYASFFNYNPKGLKIDKMDCPIWSGSESTGIFAIDFWSLNQGIAVGGDYTQDQDNRNNILLTYNAGQSWEKPETAVSGYRSDVMYVSKDVVLATGTSGTDISYDAGKNWKNISKLSFNTLGKSKDGKKIYLTGSKGNVYLLEI